ncbi:zinc finger protein 845-like isoform X2 [Pseudophryne corroboree]
MEVHGQDILLKKQEEEVIWQTQPTHDEAELAFRVYKMLDGNEAFTNVSEFHVVPVQGEDGSIVSIQVTGIQRDEDDSQTLQTQVFELQDLEETLHPHIEQAHQEVSVQCVSSSEYQPVQGEVNQSTIQEYEGQSVLTAVPEVTSEPEHLSTPPSETTEETGVKMLYRCAECSFTSCNLTALRRHMRRHSDKYKCHLCEKTFGSTTELRIHVNVHLGIRPHKCKECDMAYGTAADLLRHTRSAHTLEKPFRCCYCDYASVEANRMKVHIRSHTGERPYTCSLCSFATTDAFKLRRHMRTHTGEKPYTCHLCQAKFTQNTSMKMHILRKHTENVPKEHCAICNAALFGKNDVQVHIRKQHTYLETPLKCRFCPETFHERYILRQHQLSHRVEMQVGVKSGKNARGNKVDGQDSETEKDGFAWSIVPANGETQLFLIDDGDQSGTVTELHSIPMHAEDGSIVQAIVMQSADQVDTAVYEVQDIAHVLQPLVVPHASEPVIISMDPSITQPTQSGEEQSVTPECDLQETDTSEAQITARKGKRIQLVTPEAQIEVKLHRCKDCEKAFATGMELLKHKKKHKSENLFKCPFCDHEVAEAADLILHVQLHNESRPFTCDQCSFATTDAFKLSRHMRTHTGEKPFACSLCQAKFTQKTSMEMHVLRKHTKELPKLHCPICNTILTGKHSLKIHIRKQHSHSETEMKCRFCPETFHERFVLRQHQKTHRNEKSVRSNGSGISCKRKRDRKETGMEKHQTLHLLENEPMNKTQEQPFVWQMLPTDQETQIHFVISETEDTNTVTGYHVLPMHTEDGGIISIQLTGLQEGEQVDVGALAQIFLAKDV